MPVREKMKRLTLFVFFDKDGVVDDYKVYYLAELAKNSSKVLIIVNGKILDEEKPKLEKYGELIERENVGFDVTAYRFGIETIGYEELATYDELILCNDTVFGPLYPFSEVFKEMDKKEIDLWGLTKGYSDIIPLKGKIIEFGDHIHSYFIAIRGSILQSNEFKEYWQKFPKITGYYDAVFKFEVRFTEFFCKKGYSYDVFVQTDDIKNLTKNHLAFMTTELLENRRLPIVKRRHLYSNLDDFMSNTIANELRDSFSYVRNSTQYDTNMMWDTVLRNGDLYNIWKQLVLTEILPADCIKTKPKPIKFGAFVHIYREDMAEYMKKQLSVLPAYTDLHISTNTVEKKQIFKQVFSDANFNSVTVHIVKNRGRGEGALLVGLRKVIMKYDVACVMHDKSSPYEGASNYTISHGFSYKVYENMTKSPEYVNNILQTFIENERLGVAMPPEPNHALYDSAFANLWTNPMNFDNTQKLLSKLGCSVQLTKDQHPIFPVGGMFWCRPKALEKMFKHDWKYEDFPAEPIQTDGTFLHAIERSYSYVAQDAGYYSSIVMNDKFAELEYGNLKYNLQNVYADIRLHVSKTAPLGVKTLDKHLRDILNDNRRAYRIGYLVLYPVRKARNAARRVYHRILRLKRGL
jgi:lipopolysaccharide biosynthesis protein